MIKSVRHFNTTVHQQNEKDTHKGVLFALLTVHTGQNRTHLRACTNWVRISDESRCQLASIRLGRNSSVRSLPACFCPAKVRVTLISYKLLHHNRKQIKARLKINLAFCYIQAHAVVPFDKNFIFLILNLAMR